MNDVMEKPTTTSHGYGINDIKDRFPPVHGKLCALGTKTLPGLPIVNERGMEV